MEKQAVLKAEEIEMTFNYWDGSGRTIVAFAITYF